jgi:hypothetical protein
MTVASRFRFVGLLLGLVLGLGSALASAQSIANGESLYRQYCQVCHGFPPSAGPDRAPNNPALIRGAIASKVPDMRSLGFLTDANLADIAAWLGSLSAPPPPPPGGPAAPAFDYTDLWYGGETESGWGLNIIQHASSNIFAVMYTYAANNKPMWFVLPGGHWSSANTFTGAWYRVTGPSYAQQPFDPAKVKVLQVGTATLTFTDASHGTLAFTVDGVAVSKPILRQPF